MTNRKPTFEGGPFDGYPIEPCDWEFDVHSFDFSSDGRIAIYAQNEAGDAIEFVEVRHRDERDDSVLELDMPWRL